VIAAVGALSALSAPTAPALAQPSGDTAVTFTVATATLEIDVRPSDYVGSGLPGDTIGSRLGVVEVRDQRAATSATWTATVTSTPADANGGPGGTIQPTHIRYWSGPAIATTGTGEFVPGQPTAADAVRLNRPQTVFAKTSGSGNNTARWNPTLEVTIPNNALRGQYAGTMTHSVA
jgi:hypothetical protein